MNEHFYSIDKGLAGTVHNQQRYKNNNNILLLHQSKTIALTHLGKLFLFI